MSIPANGCTHGTGTPAGAARIKNVEIKTSHVVKIAAAVGIAAIVILQTLQSNEENKVEKISDAILTLEKKVSAELETVEKEEQAKTANPSPSPSPSLSPSPSPSPIGHL
jgi:hypothetical protein